MTIAPVLRILEALDVRVALIGAHAMAARGYPRFTADIDLLTTDIRVLDAEPWAPLVELGASVDCRRGDADDPLAGVVHVLMSDGTDIDIIVGRWAWQTALIERADSLDVMGAVLGVPRTSDLILLKLSAGGYIDRQDAAALLALGDRPRIAREIYAQIESVKPDIRAAWQELLASVPEE